MESSVRASDWLEEIVFSTNEAVRQDVGARPGGGRASRESPAVGVRRGGQEAAQDHGGGGGGSGGNAGPDPAGE